MPGIILVVRGYGLSKFRRDYFVSLPSLSTTSWRTLSAYGRAVNSSAHIRIRDDILRQSNRTFSKVHIAFLLCGNVTQGRVPVGNSVYPAKVNTSR